MVSDFKYFNYDPSLAAAVIFVVVYAGLTVVHIWKMFKTRTWFMTALIAGGVFETIGYIGRVIACQQTPNWTLVPYLIQTLFVLVAPALFSATIYMLLGRIVVGVDAEHHSIIRKRWLTKIFVTGDVFSFFVQAAAGGFMSQNDADKQKLGENIMLGGLFLQIVLFCLFLVVAFIFHGRLSREPTPIAQDPHVRWELYMIVLYVTSALVLIRNAVRVVEFIQGFQGYILSHEIFLYLFDALLLALVMVIYFVWHPAKFFECLKGWSHNITSVDSQNDVERGHEINEWRK